MRRSRDPRPHQIAVLSTLLLWGLLALDFEVSLAQAVAGLAASLGTQWLCSRIQGLPFEPRSALISGLSLALLLRVDSPTLAAAAGFLAIASKFAIRVNGRHVFNPSCFAIVVLLETDPQVGARALLHGGERCGLLCALIAHVVPGRMPRQRHPSTGTLVPAHPPDPVIDLRQLHPTLPRRIAYRRQ